MRRDNTVWNGVVRLGLAASVALALGLSVGNPAGLVQVQAATKFFTCYQKVDSNPGLHWYGRAISGSGKSNAGTKLVTTVPPPGTVVAQGFSDEAAWLAWSGDHYDSLEVGMITGSDTNGITVSGRWIPYWTTGDGGIGAGGTEVSYDNLTLAVGKPISMYATVRDNPPGGTHAAIGAVSAYPVNTSTGQPWSISTPRRNFSQGEVYEPSATGNPTSDMGGGPGGEAFRAFWSNDPDRGWWYQWGWMKRCWNKPYYIHIINHQTYRNGGPDATQANY